MTERILLIEDNENNRYLVTFLLEAAGYEVVQAGDGPSGVALAARLQPALVLLDIQLPGMDGYAVARALKADAATAALPIVAVTSHAMAGDRGAALAAGCRGYLTKPIDPDTFVATVRRHLQGDFGGAEAS
ncbi:MAG: response regulator [Burkholderiales bacterium]|nr:response regulator [Burkholderiales bacterium]